MDSVQVIKQRFGIIGNDPRLNRAIDKAIQVAPTDISVLISGESGVGKEAIPKIIHQLSHRKHAKLIAVNCGAIPEGTIDSELFGHEKGAFTGASNAREGYFQVANGGVIFLDEVGELPLTTQVRLLRVLENGEFIRVGSSEVQKTDVRIVAATNVNMLRAIDKGKFRDDLYYRLNTVEIQLPALRDRKDDIHLLFRKFASDFASKYAMPTIQLAEDAIKLLNEYGWRGNIRQLRNVVEQLSILETNRTIPADVLKGYLPVYEGAGLPSKLDADNDTTHTPSEREMLYKVLFDVRSDLSNIKSLLIDLIREEASNVFRSKHLERIKQILGGIMPDSGFKTTPDQVPLLNAPQSIALETDATEDDYSTIEASDLMPNISLQDKEIEMIKKALERHNGKRKKASEELGISERTLYRKIKQYDLEE